jgi:DNA-binding transcriptional LysR family regulator
VGRVPLAWIGAPAWLPDIAEATPATLRDVPVISDVRGSRLHAIVLEWFAGGGAVPRVHHACSDLQGRLRLAAQGVGVALASPAAAVRELRAGRLRELPAAPPLPTLDYVIASPAAGVSRPVAVVVALSEELLARRPDMAGFYAAAAGACDETKPRSER